MDFATEASYYTLLLEFPQNHNIYITSFSRPIIRYVFDCIITNTDVREADIRKLFPEELI